VVEAFTNLGIQSVGTTPEQAADSIGRDMPIYSSMVDVAAARRKYGLESSSISTNL
jgi:hypothetical protein